MSQTQPAKPKPAARTRSFACPNCGGAVEIRANGISVSAICASCGATIDVASPELKIIAEAQARTRQPDIPIGKRGALFGTEWEVVGFQARSYPAKGYSWDEYLLFNPYRGFRFLVHDSDGWTFIRMLRDDVQPPALPDGEEPEQSEARTDYVLGEFYWRARAGDVARVTEYATKRETWVCERTGDEVVWSRGAEVPTGTVQAAFGLAPAPPASHRSQDRAATVRAIKLGVAAAVLLLVLDGIPFGRSHNRTIYEHSYTVTSADRGRWLTSDPFEIPDSGGNLRIEAQSPVRNHWVELDLSLSREPSGPTFSARETISYYSGIDSDGPWTEGAQTVGATFASVPGGTYRLLVQPDSDMLTKPVSAGVSFNPAAAKPPPEPTVAFTVRAIRHASAPEFFWLALLLILVYPAYRLLFRRGSR